MICQFVSWKLGKISRTCTSITSKPNNTSTVQSKTTSNYIIALYCIQLPQHFVPQVATWDASASSGAPLPGALATQDPLNPLTVQSGSRTIRGVAPWPKSWRSWQYTTINRRNVHQNHAPANNAWKWMHETTWMKHGLLKMCAVSVCKPLGESASCNIRETHAASKAARMRFSFLPRATEKFASCRAKQNTEKKHRTTTSILDRWMSESQELRKEAHWLVVKRQQLKTLNFLRLFGSTKTKQFPLVALEILGPNTSSGHSLQMSMQESY